MKSNPILDEVWRIKDQLAAEADYDIHQFCENTRRWAAEHPHNGPVVDNAEELRQLLAEKERQQAEEAALREEPPRTQSKTE
ncbi:MAG TPA: hypothetical protein VMS21_04480 [Methylomirabilota bacterium]|nr:hypothetical protein [Methylomirabilota bacterium]